MSHKAVNHNNDITKSRFYTPLIVVIEKPADWIDWTLSILSYFEISLLCTRFKIYFKDSELIKITQYR